MWLFVSFLDAAASCVCLRLWRVKVGMKRLLKRTSGRRLLQLGLVDLAGTDHCPGIGLCTARLDAVRRSPMYKAPCFLPDVLVCLEDACS